MLDYRTNPLDNGGQRMVGLPGAIHSTGGTVNTTLNHRNGTCHITFQAINHATDLIRRLAGFGSQRSDFVRHHRETSPLLAGTGGLYSRVQSKQVGLLGNAPNDFDDPIDLFTAL